MLKRFFTRRFVAIVIFLVALTAIAALSTHLVNRYATQELQIKLIALLPRIEKKLGLKLRVSDVTFRLFTGTTFSDIVISPANEGAAPLVRLPRVHIRHRPCFTPRAGLCLHEISIERPWIATPLLSSTDESKDGKTVETDAPPPMPHLSRIRAMARLLDATAHPLVRISPTVVITWKGGHLDITNERFLDLGKPLLLRLGDISGRALFGRHTESLELKLKGSIEPVQDASGAFMADGVLKLDIATRLPKTGEPIPVNFQIQIADLTLDYWRIADHPIEKIALFAKGALAIDTTARRVTIEQLGFGSRRQLFDVKGSIEFAEKPILDAHITAKNVALQDLLNDIPADFIPLLKGTRIAGTLDLNLDLNLDLAKPGKLVFEPTVEIKEYALLAAPEGADISKLKEPFHQPVYKDGKKVKTLWMSSRSNEFISYKNLGDYITKGVLTCEDGSFFRHSGFRVEHIRDSIVQNIREKRFARGASTITMQTAKNLFLSGKKNMSRKFQEMLIAYAMEQELDKERILEIYLNLVEWGPGIYGIGPAAKHYFDKHPRDLSALEAAFLGSILPRPTRYHHMYKAGGVSNEWQNYLMLIVGKMEIPTDEYYASKPFQPEFGWVRKEREEREGE